MREKAHKTGAPLRPLAGMPPATWFIVILAGGFLLFQAVHTIATLGGIATSEPDSLPVPPRGLLQGVYHGSNLGELRHVSIREGEIRFPIDQALMGDDGRPDDASVRLSGNLVFPTPGDYTIFVSCDDGGRLHVDGEVLLDAWPRRTLTGHAVPLPGREAGAVSFLFEATNATSLGWIELEWEGPGFARRRMSGTDFQPAMHGEAQP